ncbi:conserved hypothetical protein [Leishmania mexicana MHOM/GT/2001/U1103]|uniref:Uncharacterized protein n=1 Tax=Leishmania mexicana (strain MHOM/GT/2001/U1103) TaxID=929439 RepID=E9B3P7_LEIMU|nr:conserved hypothetical protein [Leishmania mexicana MHOM/GT/2001/U1103]CBZ29864.1 conserved hypothetical protein [Leishmania mexicana MHOM/GT/2001/U1103]
MMRGTSQLAARSVHLSAASCATAAALLSPHRFFGSKYTDDLGNYKRPYTYESRSAAHRHPTRKEMLQGQRAATAASANPASGTAEFAKADAFTEEAEAEVPVQRCSKNKYEDLFKKKSDQRIAFTSNFREPDMKPILDAADEAPRSGTARRHSSAPAAVDMDETDVTRIYSKEEVRNMQQREKASTSEAAKAKTCSGGLSGISSAPETAQRTAAEVEAQAPEDDEDEFAEIRSHPFFMDMLRRVERNMIRFRKETRAAGRYSLEAVNECVRPLLQLTDYPLTARQLSHLSHSISPAVLKSSLRDRAACRHLQLYRSQDTDLLLDWSKEDFLRRRYESVHLSWEPMDVICRRFGWTPDMMSDRDYLLYFSAFLEYVEMAEMQTTAKGEPKAIPINDPVARAAEDPIPASRLLLRRKASVDAEPSLTESIRLMGSPALATPAKGKKAQRMRQHGGDSVADYFGAVEATASTVDGDETVKLQHAADNVPPLRQASHPGGRTIREFSIPKSHLPETLVAPAAMPSETGMRSEASFDQKKFEELSNAYHNVKVENSLLRRRMLGTDSVDKAQEMQSKLASGRCKQLRLEQELERMRELKRNTPTSKNGLDFSVPRGQPQYPEAPEHTTEYSKNGKAVEDIDDDEIEQALKEFKENEALRMMERRPMPNGARSAPSSCPGHAIATTNSADAVVDDGSEEVEEVIEVVEDEDEDLVASGNAAAVGPQTGAQDDVLTAESEADDSADAHYDASADAAAKESPERGDQPWQDELSAAVEQHEAEMEEQESDLTAAFNDTPATTPASRLEQLASLHDRLSSAADRARRYVATVQIRRQDVLKRLDCQLADANTKVEQLEDQLAAVEEEQTTLQDTLAREEAERKALEVEAQLKAQRERRLAELEEQRERARLAQEAAARALERQKKAEREALEMEEELQRKLREVQAKLRVMHDSNSTAHNSAAVGTPRASAAEELEAEEAAEEEHAVVSRAESSPSHSRAPESAARVTVCARSAATEETPNAVEGVHDASAAPVSSGQFMCTPEQYDGLHLAAERLKREIAALEAQMEEAGDEDDETLMAVLAASRSDLEELEECIGSVQANAPWAATRDAKRAREKALSAEVANTDAHRLQSRIDNHRFQISLLEKRLQHASKKAVITKLKDRIVQARKSITHLRMEQDRLRRAGRDSMGLPPSMSIAETLAHESKDEAETKLEEMRKASGEGNCGSPVAAKRSGLDSDAQTADDDESYDAVSDATSPDLSGESKSAGHAPSAPNSDAEKLRLRLDSMVKDIQHLQDSIEAQERTTDYDDDETEVVLREMKDKLSQLLRLRDQVQRSLLEESVNNPDTAGAPTAVIRPASAAASAPPVVARGSAAVHSGPSPSQHRRLDCVPMASKRLRTTARSFTTQRHL